jgi:hypothetical protein
MPDLHPTRYFSATLNTLQTGAENSFTCTDFDEEQQETLAEAAEIIRELQSEFENR